MPLREETAHPAVAVMEGPSMAGEAGLQAPGQGRRPGPQEEVNTIRPEAPAGDGPSPFGTSLARWPRKSARSRSSGMVTRRSRPAPPSPGEAHRAHRLGDHRADGPPAAQPDQSGNVP